MADADHELVLHQHYSPKVRRLQCHALLSNGGRGGDLNFASVCMSCLSVG